MAKEKIAAKKSKIRKKSWYTLVATKSFNNEFLGETSVYGPSELAGKTLNISLSTLTNDPKKQNINVTFAVESIDGEKGICNVTGYEMLPSSVKRFVRRNRERVDDSFICYTSDKVRVRLKPLLITSSNVKHSLKTVLRKAVRSYLRKQLKSFTYDQLVYDLISSKLQHDLKAELKKISPLKVVEIRTMKIEKKKGAAEEAEEQEGPEKKEEPKEEEEEFEEGIEEAEKDKGESEEAEEEQIEEKPKTKAKKEKETEEEMREE